MCTRGKTLTEMLLIVLVIEDDDAIQSIVEDALSEGGFEAAIAKTGEEAVTLLKSRLVAYCALVTDINLLGRVNGWRSRGRRARPIPGAAAHEWPAQGVPNSIILQKPFVPAQLTTAASQLLNERMAAD